MGFVQRVWYGSSAADLAARAVLWPMSRLYDAAATAKNLLYDLRVLNSEAPALPTISVGNLTVGGTGKTPFAAWLAEVLRARGAHPAIVLRGYGGDEPEVHRRLNPGTPVVVDADRVAGVRAAAARGADVVVLDDGFQHRRIKRSADIVLVSAEQLLRPRRLLPSGPWRESLASARRGDLVVITRKSADAAAAQQAAGIVRDVVGDIAIAAIYLRPVKLVEAVDATPRPLERLRGARVVALTAIGEPDALAAQLASLGAIVELRAYRDHHAFTDEEIAAAARAGTDGFVVCTLKDAVKLAHRWPRHSRLWYVSQQLVVEQGSENIDRLLQRALDARSTPTITAG